MSKMTTLLSLPNEILVTVAAVLDFSNLAALATTNRRLCSIANPALYAAAALDNKATRLALFYAAENGFIEPARRLLVHGVNPNVVYVSPIPRDCLQRVLAAQGRRPGRQALIDRKLALEAIRVTISVTDSTTELGHRYRALRAALFSGRDDKPDISAHVSSAYSFLVYELQTIGTQTDRVFNPSASQAETEADVTVPWDTDHMYQWTALHVAAQRGDNDLVKLLLDSGALVDPLLRLTEAPAHMGVWKGHARSYPLESPPPESTPETPLHLAISAGHDSTARLLMSHGASPAVPSGGVTALHVASWHGALALCRSILDANPGLVDVCTEDGLTPFHYAVAAGHFQMVGRFLLDRGADIRAHFTGRIMIRDEVHAWPTNVFTHALLNKRYAEAETLWDLNPGFDLLERGELSPVRACLLADTLCEDDEDQMVPILRRLIFTAGPRTGPLHTTIFLSSYLAYETSAKHLPKTWKLLLEISEDEVLPVCDVTFWLTAALQVTECRASVKTIMAFVDRVVSTFGVPTPGLHRIFPPNGGLIRKRKSPAMLDIANLLYERLAATSPERVSDLDLLQNLKSACQSGALEACEWLAGLGALRGADKNDFLTMLDNVAQYPDFGAVDEALVEWLLLQADKAGLKRQVLASVSVPAMIWSARGFSAAKVVVREGASLELPRREDGSCSPDLSQLALFSTYTRQRLTVREYHPPYLGHAFLMACGQPDKPGAAQFARLAIDRMGGDAGELVNAVLIVFRAGMATPASLACCTNIAEPDEGELPSESARLAMLRVLLDAGAEVHTLVERIEDDDREWDDDEEDEDDEDDEDGGGHNADIDTESSESLWHALASQDKAEIIRQQQALPGWDGVSRWNVLNNWKHAPVLCAIRSRMPTLVRAMLEARPLPTRNSPAALRYLRIACSDVRRPSPEILEMLLDMTNLDHADLPLDGTGETALMVLLQFYEKADWDGLAPVHECRCEPDLAGDVKDDLTRMVNLLLERGAKWETETVEGRTALDDLQDALCGEMRNKSIYKQHNLAELRRNISPDLYSGAPRFPDMDLEPLLVWDDWSDREEALRRLTPFDDFE